MVAHSDTVGEPEEVRGEGFAKVKNMVMVTSNFITLTAVELVLW